MALAISIVLISASAVCATLAGLYAYTRRDKEDKHTWIDDLFGSEEA